MKRFILLICAAMLLCGCGKEEITNLSIDAIDEFKNGKDASEVFEEDTVTALLSNSNQEIQELVSAYISSIEITSVEYVNGMVYYNCKVKDVSNVVADIINTDSFKTEIDKRKISGDFSDLDSLVYGLALNKLATCDYIDVKVAGYLNSDKLVTSKDLMLPLYNMLDTEIPNNYSADEDSTAVQLDTVSGDFVTVVDSCRILISDVSVMEGSDAESAVQELDSANSCNGVFVTFKATNLSKKDAVITSRFCGVTDDFHSVINSNNVIGLRNTVEVKSGETVEMTDCISIAGNGTLVWNSEDRGSYIYKWKEDVNSE